LLDILLKTSLSPVRARRLIALLTTSNKATLSAKSMPTSMFGGVCVLVAKARSVANVPELLSPAYPNRVRDLSPRPRNQSLQHLPGPRSSEVLSANEPPTTMKKALPPYPVPGL